MKTRRIFFGLFLCGCFTAQAQFIEINLNQSTNVNEDAETYSVPGNYQLGGTQINVNGVPFGLSELNNNPNTTGIVQGGGVSHDTVTGSFSFSFSVPAGIQATALYSLVNSVYGEAGTNEASIVVTGTHLETTTLNLVEGVNIRDCNQASWCNTLSDPTIVSTYFVNKAPATNSIQTRLDRQELVLPDSFSGDTIATITFQGYGQGDPNGSAFLAGLTLLATNYTVPSVPLLGFGFPLRGTNGLNLTLQGPVGTNYEVDISSNLLTWSPATNFVSTMTPFYFSVLPAANSPVGFYRAKIQ